MLLKLSRVRPIDYAIDKMAVEGESETLLSKCGKSLLANRKNISNFSG
ncbi:hypothetical protein lpl1677 [Legionella pneumophila str. Lens]|uniref:Uncharacterized protein n=1 Tax=Legionella pneumophila (strain Lens) TaxID=297245 RepID=Q5WVY3_LEGPL|nr:hypothetical protein lpl1677 [Legionella pneumophila str. Lens]